MFATLRFRSALLGGLVLCQAGVSHAQTVTYGETNNEKAKDVHNNLGQIELKLEAVLDLLPATLSGEDLETARKQINTAFDTMVAGVKKAAPLDAGYKFPLGGPVAGPGPGPVTTPSLDLKPNGDRKEAARSPVGRYQISSWTLPPSSGQGSYYVGAFIVDTQTGTVWRVLDGQSPKKLGQVKD